MAGPNYANSKEHAKMYTQVLEDRPREIPFFAENGVLQYKWSKEIISRLNRKTEKTSVETKSHMEASDYSRIRDSMLELSPITSSSHGEAHQSPK
eukprot:2282376-Pyramimonas_sp.AAC.1